MNAITLDYLFSQTRVKEFDDGLLIYVPQSWIVVGEDRLSYSTIIRLVECCREYHWKKDITIKYPLLDSICGQINANFFKPISAEQFVKIKYSISFVSDKKYMLNFLLHDSSEILCGYVEMVLYFYDSQKKKSVCITPNLNL